MFDYLMTFADEATAQADPVVGRYYYVDESWDTSRVMPNVAVTVHETGLLYDDSWWIMIASDQQSAALRDHPACFLVADRRTGGLIDSSLPIPELALLRVAPVPAGSDYLFGAPP
jgi:hypothetical protein